MKDGKEEQAEFTDVSEDKVEIIKYECKF